MDWIQFLSAFGLGAIVAALIQAWLSHRAYVRQRNFQEKKEAYVGLLQAYHRAAIERSDAAAKEFAYWQIRCQLIAPAHVREAVQAIIDSNDDRDARATAHLLLQESLRQDLGVAPGR